MAIGRGTDVYQVGPENSAGLMIGAASTTLIGFYGETPVDQPTAITHVNTTSATSTTNAFGYTAAAQADGIVTAINAILDALEELGLVNE
jgi:hypothetical protein